MALRKKENRNHIKLVPLTGIEFNYYILIKSFLELYKVTIHLDQTKKLNKFFSNDTNIFLRSIVRERM